MVRIISNVIFSHPRRICGLLLVAFLLAGTPLQAEELHTRFFRDITLGGGLHFQHWSGEGDLSIHEFSVPITFILPISNKLSLDLVTGSGFATLDRESSDDLNGFKDTKIRASYLLGEEVALITVGVSTPTGKTELDIEEQEVSSFLSQNALGFRTANFGQGLDLNLGLALARKLGETVYGLGVGYLVKGEFTPQDGGGEYAPSDELSFTFGFDRKIMDGDGKLTLDAVYTLYEEDEIGGRSVYESGDKLMLQALGVFHGSALDWRVHLIERTKAKNTSFSGVNPEKFSNGNQFEVGVSVLQRSAGSAAWRGMVDVKRYEENARGVGEATLFGVGPGLRLKFSPQRFIDLNVKYSRGTIDQADVNGLEIGGQIWLKL